MRHKRPFWRRRQSSRSRPQDFSHDERKKRRKIKISALWLMREEIKTSVTGSNLDEDIKNSRSRLGQSDSFVEWVDLQLLLMSSSRKTWPFLRPLRPQLGSGRFLFRLDRPVFVWASWFGSVAPDSVLARCVGAPLIVRGDAGWCSSAASLRADWKHYFELALLIWRRWWERISAAP